MREVSRSGVRVNSYAWPAAEPLSTRAEVPHLSATHIGCLVWRRWPRNSTFKRQIRARQGSTGRLTQCRRERTTETATYSAPIEEVYAVAIDTASQHGYAIRSAFPEAHVVSFTSRRARQTDHAFTATAIENPFGVTSVVIAGANPTSRYLLADNAELQTWHERKKLALLFLRHIERALVTTADPGHKPRERPSCPWCIRPKQASFQERAVRPVSHRASHALPVARYEEKCDSLIRALRNTRRLLREGDGNVATP
jgi:hypothetical protein